VDIDPDGKCSHCNHTLRENHRLTDAEFGHLKTAIEQYAGLAEARQDIFPGELSALRSTVESLLRKPPKRAVVSKLSSVTSPAPSSSTELCHPMVVDGLALIEQFRLFGKSLHLIAHLIEAQAVEEYWPILLIDRPERTRKYVSPFLDLVKQGVRRVCSNNAWANDALVMYAALCMGPGADVLTDDNFVSHALQFRPADAKLLRRWASSNLLYVDRALRGNCVQKPASFAVESQIDGDACHIPVLLMRGGAQTCVQWICVRKRDKTEEKESASEKMEEKEIARKRPEEKEAVQEKTAEEDPGEPKVKKVSNKRKRGRPLKAIY